VGVETWRRGGTILPFNGSARCGGMSFPCQACQAGQVLGHLPVGSRLHNFDSCNPPTTDLAIGQSPQRSQRSQRPAFNSPRSFQSFHYYMLKPDIFWARRVLAMRCDAGLWQRLVGDRFPPPSTLTLPRLVCYSRAIANPPLDVGAEDLLSFRVLSFPSIHSVGPRPLSVFPVSRRICHVSWRNMPDRSYRTFSTDIEPIQKRMKEKKRGSD